MMERGDLRQDREEPQCGMTIDQVGLHGRSCNASELSQAEAIETGSVFAGVLPEDKFKLVKALQAQGHVVGMTGDGVNDAPALRQAEVGVAVANAADVAKAAASLVLTRDGLGGLVLAIESSRRIYQRMLTSTRASRRWRSRSFSASCC